MLLKQGLEKLGFDENETRVYLAAAECGKATATVISKRAGIPRGSIYGILNGLLERGVVAVEQSVGTSYYTVSDPSSLVRMVDKERDEIETKEDIAKQLVDLVLPYLKSAPTGAPKLQFVEGKRSIDNMLFQSLPSWRKSFAAANDYTVWGIVDHTMMGEYRKWLLHRWNILEQSNQERIQLFSNQPAVAESIKQRVAGREIRMLPQDTQISGSIFLYGEYLVMMMTRDKPHVAFQIHSPVLAANLRAIFKLLWSVTTPARR